MSDEDYQERYRRESRRRREIRDFRAQQRISREWIPVDEIIEWCVASQTRAGPAEAESARSLAFDRLDQSVRAGDFEIEGQTQIKWLHPRYPDHQWLTREQLSVFGTILDQASRCWLPRKLARQWLAAHGDQWPAHFLPASERGVESTPREPASLDQLAEWIFARHVRGANPFDKRYSEAMKDNTIEGFKKADFRIAYRRVYETEPHRPLATGWPLRSPYRDRVRME